MRGVNCFRNMPDEWSIGGGCVVLCGLLRSVGRETLFPD